MNYAMVDCERFTRGALPREDLGAFQPLVAQFASEHFVGQDAPHCDGQRLDVCGIDEDACIADDFGQ
jgi:hypothetical protein